MTLAGALAMAKALGLERLDAQLLLLHALDCGPGERAWLLAHDTDALPAQGAATFGELCERRRQGEPLAYLVGQREFFGLPLLVDRRVLVPRPDTETLVEWALSVAGDDARIIDLGTGSGAIALAIKSQRPGARVEAVDADADALCVARANAGALRLDVEFRQDSWLAGALGHFDLIVSNPPYIRSEDPHLPALRHEPLQALASGPDGLDDLRAIISQAPARLRPGGWLLLEHGHDQAGDVRRLLADAGFSSVSSRTDLAGIERCSGGTWREQG